MSDEGILRWWQKWNRGRANDRLIKDEPPVPVMLVNAIGSSGEVIFGHSATVGPPLRTSAIEDNSALIYSTNVALGRQFGATAMSTVAQQTLRKRILATSITATAGGEIATTPLFPALAGYETCGIITGVWSDQTDAGVALTFTVGAGTIDYGPVAWTIATTAGTVTDYSPGVPFHADTDNNAISVAAAAGQAGNAQEFIFIGEYWWET